jgi:hypothetical protein
MMNAFKLALLDILPKIIPAKNVPNFVVHAHLIYFVRPV